MIEELAHGLFRWTAAHPEWQAGAEPESPEDWPEQVGCVAVAGPTHLVLIDPLVEEWQLLDRLVEQHRLPVAILTTLRPHARSREAAAERYGAVVVAGDDEHPEGVEPIPIEHGDEAMLWRAGDATLVLGDRLLGDGRGGVRMCPESWLASRATGLAELRADLRQLLDLPVRRVLVSHGEPVWEDGRAAIVAALA